VNTKVAYFLAASLMVHAGVCQAQTYTILHTFKGGKDGASPLPGSGAGFAADASGNLYGVTGGQDTGTDFGTIFELSPPSAGSAWTETVLYRFKGGMDGDFPGSTLLPDGSGGFYSTTLEGGVGNCAPLGTEEGCGTAFHLTPPSRLGAAWKETVLYRFSGSADGAGPTGPFIGDQNGSLYSMTNAGGRGSCVSGTGCGTVYRLDPPAKGNKGWTETVLYAFTGNADGGSPEAGLTMDAAGNLYGATSYGGNLNCAGGIGCGVVFELSPPGAGQSAWTETVLYTFTDGSDGAFPQPAPILNSSGALLGTAQNGGTGCSYGCGVVYELTPPKKGQKAWTFTALYALGGPPDGAYLNAALVPDGSGSYVTGTFYGGTGSCAFMGAPTGCGTVLKLTPPAKRGGGWKETVLYSLPAQSDGSLVGSQLSVDAAGVIYGATFNGGDSKYCSGNGCGVAFSLTPTQ
jgi:uncharacterized protein YceK